MIEIVYQFDPAKPVKTLQPESPERARLALESGNETFAHLLDRHEDGQPDERRVVRVSAADLGFATLDATAPVQRPFAVVVGCADARVPIELILGQRANDLFVVRVAGNVLGEEILGSVDYALANLESVRLLVVLGHSGCGAVTAAVDAFLDPAKYLTLSTDHQIRAIVNQIYPAVRLGHEALVNAWGGAAQTHPGFREALIEVAVALNAALMAATLRDQLTTRGSTHIEAVYSVYQLATRHAVVPGVDGQDADAHRLLAPPADATGFAALGRALAREAMGETG